MSRLDRYIFSEAIGPTFLGFVVSTFILLIRAFFELAEAVIRRGVPAGEVLQLLALNLPHIVVITIPMALLFGILVAVGRLSADSELTALRAAGVSLFYLYRGLLALAIVLAGINVALMIWVLPWGNQTYQTLLLKQLSGDVTTQLEPRIFNQILEDRTIYIFDVPPGETRWKGVFIADSLPIGQTHFTVAESGSVNIDQAGNRLIVELDSAIQQQLDLNAPTEAQISGHRVLTFANEGPNREGSVVRSRSSQVRELSWKDLRAWYEDEERTPVMRALARVEMHKKFSIPAACLVFGLVALPLGFSRRPGGRSSAFSLAIAVIAIYYVLQNMGEDGAANGRLSPWLAMWLPNLIFLVAGAFLLARKNSDKSLFLARGDLWLRQHLWLYLDRLRPSQRAAKKQGAAQSRTLTTAGAPFLIHLPHFNLRFPSRFDRYLLRVFIKVGLLVLAGALMLYIVVDLSEMARFVMENDIPASMVIEHYQYHSLQIFYLVAPIVVLLTTLISFGLLSRTNEITAAKALGISLYRLALPVLLASAVVAGATALLDFTFLPAANARKAELRRIIKGHPDPSSQRGATTQWFFNQTEDNAAFIYNYLHFNPEDNLLQRFQAFRFDPQHRLTGHFYAAELRRLGDTWYARGAWTRSFSGTKVVEYRELPGPLAIDLDVEPEYFSTEVKSADEMNYLELKSYVARITNSGQQAPELETQLHNKVASPLVCLVMALVALPFAFRLGRQGALYGIGVAILVGIVLYVVMAFFTTLGEVGAMPPWLAAWSPNILFTFFSLYLFLGVRT